MFVCENKIAWTHQVSLSEGFVDLEITLKVSVAIFQYFMPSWTVFFTEGINIAGVLLLPSQGVDQDGITEGHGHHHHQREHSKERHFDEAGVAGEASEDGVAEVESECKLIKAKAFIGKEVQINKS